jgi:hypothetical protein
MSKTQEVQNMTKTINVKEIEQNLKKVGYIMKEKPRPSFSAKSWTVSVTKGKKTYYFTIFCELGSGRFEMRVSRKPMKYATELDNLILIRFTDWITDECMDEVTGIIQDFKSIV